MRTFVQVAFYTWLIASMVALVVYRRRKSRSDGESGASLDASLPIDAATGGGIPSIGGGAGERRGGSRFGAATSASSPPLDPLTPSRPVAPMVPRELLDTPTHDEAGEPTGTEAAAGPVGGGPLLEPTGPDAVEAGAPPTDTGDRRGLFASGSAPSPVTIGQALAGVNWPCGLTPVIRMEDLHQSDRRVVFSTIGEPAAEVGRQVADALESAGFRVTSLDDATALARRGTTSVAMVLHPDASKVHTAGRPEFPTLPPSSVVLVCDLHAGA